MGTVDGSRFDIHYPDRGVYRCSFVVLCNEKGRTFDGCKHRKQKTTRQAVVFHGSICLCSAGNNSVPCRTLYAGRVLINMHIKQEFLFEEKRTCPAVSKRLGKSTDTWYLTKETKEDNYTYSSIILDDSTEQGKKILLIGLNPRGEKPISEEAMEYEEAKKISPDMKHRKECKNAIEPTRRQVLTDILSKFPDIKFSELITVDIFSSRTKDSANLYKKIKNSGKPEEFIGSTNKDVIIRSINYCDIIVLAWGNIDKKLWEFVPDYRKNLLDVLNNNIGKCYRYGQTQNGSPIHPCAHRKKELKRITSEELKNSL